MRWSGGELRGVTGSRKLEPGGRTRKVIAEEIPDVAALKGAYSRVCCMPWRVRVSALPGAE